VRTWIKIFIIVAIIIAVDSVVTSYLNREHEYYEKHLTQLALYVKNEEPDKAQDIVDDVYKHWAQSHHIWETLADHSEVEQIDILFTKLSKYFPGENEDETLSDIMELYRLLEFTARRYKISIVNIL